MYFDQFGNVLACCINTVNAMGSYPAQGIAEIWSGSEAKALRAALADDDFSMGCHDCHSSISSGNYGAVNAMFDSVVAETSAEWLAGNPVIAADGRDPWPRMLELSLSNRCNLTCTMCSGYCSSAIRRADGLEPLPEIYGSEFIDELRPFLAHASEVHFYGGEPFLADVNFKALDAIAQVNPGCRVTVTTNGTVWTPQIESILQRLTSVAIVISVDGATRHTFEGIRRGARYDRVLDNINRFAAIPGCSVSLAVCAMRQNWTEIPDLVHFANERGMNLGFNVVRYPQSHSLSSAPLTELESVVEFWGEALTKLSSGAVSEVAVHNWGQLSGILAEARGWLAAEQSSGAAVSLSSGAAPSARVRRRSWLEIVSGICMLPWRPEALDSEELFKVEMDRLLYQIGATIPESEHGSMVASALRMHATSSGEGVEDRFIRFGEALAQSSVVERLRQMADLPPALISQGVEHEDPRTLEVRLNSFFPPSANTGRS